MQHRLGRNHATQGRFCGKFMSLQNSFHHRIASGNLGDIEGLSKSYQVQTIFYFLLVIVVVVVVKRVEER